MTAPFPYEVPDASQTQIVPVVGADGTASGSMPIADLEDVVLFMYGPDDQEDVW